MPLFWLVILLALSGCQQKDVEFSIINPDLDTETLAESSRTWPVLTTLSAPDGLRPCCAFGYDIQTELMGIPVPFYQVNNVVDADRLGEHRYNDSYLNALTSLMGLNNEQTGLVYTRRGGFIDIAHVRDTADNTLFLFSQIWPILGQEKLIKLSDELAMRQIQLAAFTPPEKESQRYTLSAYLAADLAFQLAAWHEIVQWHGLQSVPGFSESVSAFSPEDLYSNLLGARLALTAILNGQASSKEQFNMSMQHLLPQALHQLEAVSPAETRIRFDWVDRNWWDSQQRVPNKQLVRLRDYTTSSDRLPAMIPSEWQMPLRLTLPTQYGQFRLADLAELQLWPSNHMKKLPMPKSYWTVKDFDLLSKMAEAEDSK